MNITPARSLLAGLAALALGAAAVVPSSAGAADAPGQLRIDVVGARIPVRITVVQLVGLESGGDRMTVTGDTTLRDLTPGTYAVIPSPEITPKRKPAVTVSKSQVTVRASDTAPVTVRYSAPLPVRQLAAGEFTTCAALRSGRVRCLG